MREITRLMLTGALVLWSLSLQGQNRVFTLDLDGNEAPLLDASDRVTNNDAGDIQVISGTTHPTVKVFLPPKENNSGAAVIICSGGALMFHSWGNDVEKMAAWLNERGVAVIGLKYRLRQMQARPQRPQGPAPQGGMRLQLPDITGFDQLNKANASPDMSPKADASCEDAFQDALRTIKLVRTHAAEWGIDPERVGYLGYSAGGGVAIGATVRADADTRPTFLATCYGPALEEVTVPENAPRLFVAGRAQHTNVAAGLLALFLEWKRAGANAEMYIYDDGQGGFGPGDDTSTSGAWREHFFRWMVSNGWVPAAK